MTFIADAILQGSVSPNITQLQTVWLFPLYECSLTLAHDLGRNHPRSHTGALRGLHFALSFAWFMNLSFEILFFLITSVVVELLNLSNNALIWWPQIPCNQKRKREAKLPKLNLRVDCPLHFCSQQIIISWREVDWCKEQNPGSWVTWIYSWLCHWPWVTLGKLPHFNFLYYTMRKIPCFQPRE